LQNYDVSIDGDDIRFAPRYFSVDFKCGRKHRIPVRMTEKLETDKVLNIECECGEHPRVVWRLMLERMQDRKSQT
jgi:hypothetical protein